MSEKAKKDYGKTHNFLKISTSLLRFYFYAITSNKKKYSIVRNQNEMAMAMFSPILLVLVYPIFSALFLSEWTIVLTFLFIPIFMLNFIYLNHTNNEWHRLERKRIDKEHKERMEEQRKARERREEERARKQYEDYIESLYWEYIRQQRESERRRSRTHQKSTVDKNKLNAIKLMELSASPTVEEVKKAYRRLSKTHHPDTGGTQENFIRLSKAYDYLMKIL